MRSLFAPDPGHANIRALGGNGFYKHIMASPQTSAWTGIFRVAPGVLAAAACVYLVYVLIFYGRLSGYLDHIEPNVAIAAWRLLEGRSLYQSYDQWPLFGNYYGPVVYLAHAGVFSLAGGSVPLSKLANSAAVLAGVLVFFFYARRRYGEWRSCIGMLFYFGFLFYFAPVTIWNRPDPFAILLVVLGLAARDLPTARFGRWAPHVALGACMGLAANLKAHSFVYFLPLVVDLCGWRGIGRMTVVGAAAGAAFLAPFLLPQVSLETYVEGLTRQVGERGIVAENLKSTLRASLIYLVPGLMVGGLALVGRARMAARDILYFCVFAGCVIVVFYPASIPGSGSYHLLPLFPIAVDVSLRLAHNYRALPRLTTGVLVILAVVLLALSVPVQRRLHRNLDRLAQENVTAEIDDVVRRHKGETIQMGYGGSFEGYRKTFYKPVLVFRGNPATVDSQVIMELHVAGVDVIGKLVQEIASCRTHNWLIPKGETPFSMQSYYGGGDLFRAATDAFQRAYHRTERLRHFDLWSCKKS